MGAVIAGNDVLVFENHGMSECELTGAFRKSSILHQYRFEDGIITRHTESMELVNRDSAPYVDLEFRAVFLVYLRDANRILRYVIGEEINGLSQKHMIILESRTKNMVTTTKETPQEEHSRCNIVIGVEGLAISPKAKKNITAGILMRNDVIVCIREPSFK